MQEPGVEVKSVEEHTESNLYGAQLVQEVGFWKLIMEDYTAHRRKPFAPGFQAIFAYRICTWRMKFKNRFARYLFGLPGRIGLLIARNVYGIELYQATRIARRLVIAHQHGIVIHQYATIGNDCIVRQGVTIGVSSGWEEGVGPIIGDRVHFGVGSVIIGNIRIGSNVNIGPNCVISTNVPANTTVFAPQSRILPRNTDS